MILAHASHWTTSLIYLAPVFGVWAFLSFQSVRERRQKRHDDKENR